MQNPAPFDVLAQELGEFAGRVEREVSLRVEAALSDMRRVDAERELRFTKLERSITDLLAAIRDGRDGVDGIPGRDGINGQDGQPGERGDRGEPGQQGERGEPGIPGEPGDAGARGVPGEPGPKGDQGEPGPQGEPGDKGERGEAGTAGDPGQAGNDGAQGAPGNDGRDGANGNDGAAGRDGVDGSPGKLPIVRAWSDGVSYAGEVCTNQGATYQAIRDTGRAPPHEDWIQIAAAGSDGRSFSVKGTYTKDSEYSALDVVALNGASFVALRDAPGGCPGADWQLLCMQGKSGKPGERGIPGPEGKRGAPGPAVVAGGVDSDGLLTLTNGDGSTVTCDFYPLLSQIH